MKAWLLIKWGEYQAGQVIEHADKLASPIPSYAAEFYDDDADVRPIGVAADVSVAPAAKGRRGARKGARKSARK